MADTSTNTDVDSSNYFSMSPRTSLEATAAVLLPPRLVLVLELDGRQCPFCQEPAVDEGMVRLDHYTVFPSAF